MGSAWARNGSALWETFFEGYCANVSAWLDRCDGVERVRAQKSFYYPGVQVGFSTRTHKIQAPPAASLYYHHLPPLSALARACCR